VVAAGQSWENCENSVLIASVMLLREAPSLARTITLSERVESVTAASSTEKQMNEVEGFESVDEREDDEVRKSEKERRRKDIGREEIDRWAAQNERERVFYFLCATAVLTSFVNA
jgi:hypothetical protein